MASLTQRQTRRLLVVSWVFMIIPVAAAISLMMDLIPKHGFDLEWPAHARFHATWAAAKFLALGLMTALIARFPFRQGEKWSWVALAIYLVIGFGGFVIAMLWQGAGPPTRPLIMASTMVAIMFAGLIWSASVVFRRGAS